MGFFINWRLDGGLINRYRFRTRGPAAGDGLLFPFRLYIGGRLGPGKEIKGMLIAISRDKVTCFQQVFHRTAIATVGDTKCMLDGYRTERQFIVVFVAAQVEV